MLYNIEPMAIQLFVNRDIQKWSDRLDRQIDVDDLVDGLITFTNRLNVFPVDQIAKTSIDLLAHQAERLQSRESSIGQYIREIHQLEITAKTATNTDSVSQKIEILRRSGYRKENVPRNREEVLALIAAKHSLFKIGRIFHFVQDVENIDPNKTAKTADLKAKIFNMSEDAEQFELFHLAKLKLAMTVPLPLAIQSPVEIPKIAPSRPFFSTMLLVSCVAILGIMNLSFAYRSFFKG